MIKLTDHLLSLAEEDQILATQNDFLRKAGEGTLEYERLRDWLIQDRFYALSGYTRFISILISKSEPTLEDPDHPEAIKYLDRLAVLTSALTNIDREIRFFEQVAKRNEIDLTHRTDPSNIKTSQLNPLTRSYIDYMVSLASTRTYQESLVLLWAMEHLYYKAWSFASSFLPKPTDHQTVGDRRVKGAMSQLIPNWSSESFKSFLDSISDLVDRDLGQGWYDLEGPNLKKLTDVWYNALWFEIRFWDGKV
ncbi:heme oxygenase-like protein [Violaceomyces palustris]|uniref:Heme oxygenase-like protein n=1 Tax=Violaceomyces palustris TaxID=1673888 RepID=A0ACD0P308_9BASI|nr:heme oxygenase-like protein [Violaceomyces palustris]